MKFLLSVVPAGFRSTHPDASSARGGFASLPKLAAAVCLLAVVMASAIAWRIDGRPGTPTLLPILLWQVAIWLPWIGFFYLVQELAGRGDPLRRATPANIVLHVAAAVLIAGSHLVWYWQVSDLGSPLKGLPNTRFGVYAFFFVFWFLIDLVLYVAVLAGQSRHSQSPSAATSEEANSAARLRAARNEFLVRQGRARHVVQTEDIRWIEAQGYYAALHTNSGSYLIRQSLAKLEKELDPQRFIRVHRSTIVSLGSVSSFQTDRNGAINVVLEGGRRRRVSRAGSRLLKARLGPPD